MIQAFKSFAALSLLLMGAAASAGASGISMPDFTVDRGYDATVDVTLDTGDEAPLAYAGFQFDLLLPDGLSIEGFALDPQLAGQDFSLNMTDYGHGAYRVVAYTSGTGFATADLMQLIFRCADNVARGEAKILMRRVVFSAPDGKDIDLPDSEATVTFNTFGTAETPLQLLRKGNGTSCTFVCMMPLSNEQLESAGYKFAYGYDTAAGESQLLTDTPLRYCHTTEQIFNDPSLDFWVFAYYTDAEGTLCVSSRRHLDGRVDDDFDPEDFISATKADTRSDVSGVFTIDGRYVGRDASRLEKGIYIYMTADGSVKFIK